MTRISCTVMTLVPLVVPLVPLVVPLVGEVRGILLVGRLDGSIDVGVVVGRRLNDILFASFLFDSLWFDSFVARGEPESPLAPPPPPPPCRGRGLGPWDGL